MTTDNESSKLRIEQDRLDIERHKLAEERRRTVVQIVAAVVQVVSIVGLAATIIIGQQNIRSEQESLRLTRDRQMDDRFAKGAELLSSASEPQRVSGVYSLERVDRDTNAADDHRMIMDMLAVLIRQQAPRTRTPTEASPRGDVQAALTVIGRRWAAKGTLQAGEPLLDLGRTNLRRAVLVNASFRDTALHEADLRGALLQNVDLQGVDLRGTCLIGVDLRAVRNLTQPQVNVAVVDATTTLPPGLLVPADRMPSPSDPCPTPWLGPTPPMRAPSAVAVQPGAGTGPALPPPTPPERATPTPSSAER